MIFYAIKTAYFDFNAHYKLNQILHKSLSGW